MIEIVDILVDPDLTSSSVPYHVGWMVRLREDGYLGIGLVAMERLPSELPLGPLHRRMYEEEGLCGYLKRWLDKWWDEDPSTTFDRALGEFIYTLRFGEVRVIPPDTPDQFRSPTLLLHHVLFSLMWDLHRYSAYTWETEEKDGKEEK